MPRPPPFMPGGNLRFFQNLSFPSLGKDRLLSLVLWLRSFPSVAKRRRLSSRQSSWKERGSYCPRLDGEEGEVRYQIGRTTPFFPTPGETEKKEGLGRFKSLLEVATSSPFFFPHRKRVRAIVLNLFRKCLFCPPCAQRGGGI